MTELAIRPRSMPIVPQEPERPRTMMDTIHEAVMRGLSIDVINNLVSLQKQFAADAAKRDFDDAFAKAKAEIKVVNKDAHVGFKSKDTTKADTEYDHDTLAGIYDAAVPALSKFGLGHSFEIEQEMSPGINPGEFTQTITVTCTISGLGHSKQVKMSGPPDFEGKKTGLKAIASTVTMLSRYTLRAALGLASKKDKSDDDGAAAEKSIGPDEGVAAEESAGRGNISDAQLNELLQLADDIGIDKIKYCQFRKIDSLASIPASQFERAKADFEHKRRQANAS